MRPWLYGGPLSPSLHCPNESPPPQLWTLRVCHCVFPSARPRHTAGILHLPTAAQQLPSFPHAGLQAAQLLIGLVEGFQLMAAPAPPDTQAPLHVFLAKAAYNCVLCQQCCLLQDPERKERDEWGARRWRLIWRGGEGEWWSGRGAYVRGTSLCAVISSSSKRARSSEKRRRRKQLRILHVVWAKKLCLSKKWWRRKPLCSKTFPLNPLLCKNGSKNKWRPALIYEGRDVKHLERKTSFWWPCTLSTATHASRRAAPNYPLPLLFHLCEPCHYSPQVFVRVLW